MCKCIRSNNSFNFPLGWIKYIVIVTCWLKAFNFSLGWIMYVVIVTCWLNAGLPGQPYLRGLVPLKEGFDMESLVVMPIDIQGELWLNPTGDHFCSCNTDVGWKQQKGRQKHSFVVLMPDDLPWKDERGPSSVAQTLEPFQRQHWGHFWETGWSTYGLFRAHRYHLQLIWIEQNWC